MGFGADVDEDADEGDDVDADAGVGLVGVVGGFAGALPFDDA